MFRDLFIITIVCSSAFGSFLDGDFDLADGVKLVSIPVSNSLEDEGRSFGENSALFRMAKFLQGHELRVKLPNLIEKDKISRVFEESLKTVDETYKDSAGKYLGLFNNKKEQSVKFVCVKLKMKTFITDIVHSRLKYIKYYIILHQI